MDIKMHLSKFQSKACSVPPSRSTKRLQTSTQLEATLYEESAGLRATNHVSSNKIGCQACLVGNTVVRGISVPWLQQIGIGGKGKRQLLETAGLRRIEALGSCCHMIILVIVGELHSKEPCAGLFPSDWPTSPSLPNNCCTAPCASAWLGSSSNPFNSSHVGALLLWLFQDWKVMLSVLLVRDSGQPEDTGTASLGLGKMPTGQSLSRATAPDGRTSVPFEGNGTEPLSEPLKISNMVVV